MKSPLRILLGLVVVVVLVAVGFFVVPKLLYILPPFQSWVAGQIDKQSGGEFSFDSIKGDAFEAQLMGALLDMGDGNSNVFQARFDTLNATFELLPVALLKLDLKELKASGGEVILDLTLGDHEHIRLPVNAEHLMVTGGSLLVRNLQGYECRLEGCDLKVTATEAGKKGSFTAQTGKVGSIELSAIEGTYEFNEQGLKVTDFSATLPGESQLSLDGLIALNEEGAPVQDADLNVQTENVQALLTALGYSDRFDGAADVSVTFSGNFRPELKNLAGAGTAKLSGISAKVNLLTYPGFDDSGILKELKSITGLKGEAPFKLEGDQIIIESLPLENEKMKVSGGLKIGYNKSIAGDHTLLASPELAAGIPDVAKGVFSKNDNGWTEIPFTFSGTSNTPATSAGSVVTKALMNPVNAVKGVGGVLGGLFGGGDKKSEKK